MNHPLHPRTCRPQSSVRELTLALSRLFLAASFLLVISMHPAAAQVNIFVTTTTPGVSKGQCSLQEAIYSSEFKANTAIGTANPDVFYPTGCVPGTGNGDTIVLPTNAVLTFDRAWDQDAHNIYGSTATPVIFSNITIEGNGSTLQFVGRGNTRLFAVGVVNEPKFASSIGNLTLRDVFIKGFVVKGGDGGLIGGGGGLGAGGAIFNAGQLIVENSTFDGNGAIGGNGNQCPAGVDCRTLAPAGGGGGGFAGKGGDASVYGGGGGGGSFGAGGTGGNLNLGQSAIDGGGGGGGGTLTDGSAANGSTGGNAGFRCGGQGANSSDDAQGATCDGAGGGGGGGNRNCGIFSSCRGNGGSGAFGGGGGGGAGDGGNGGFGGGGGAGDCGFDDVNGGNGGFGGGAGAATSLGCSVGSNLGKPGIFGGRASQLVGGGGGALGGAIINYNGTLVVRNTTFTNNFVDRGVGAENGADAGGAVFSLDNTLEIVNSTFSANQSTGSGAAVVVYSDEGDGGGPGGGGSPVSFTLSNSILANNGANECFYTGGSMSVQGSGNLIMNNAAGLFVPSIGIFNACPGVVAKADPLLGPLQLNAPGVVPSMAVTSASPAFNTADSGTALLVDQRGVDRPQNGKPDIGAYEVCVESDLKLPFGCANLTVKQPPPTAALTIKATINDAGSISPAPGTYNVPLNTVTILTAIANPGFCFQSWSGNVTDPKSPSTTVIIDQAQGVTANFAQCDFSLIPVSPVNMPLASTSTTSVVVKSLGIFASTVSLSVSGQPVGVTAAISPASVTPAAAGTVHSVLGLSLSPAITPQTFSVSINGVSGSLAHSDTITVNVTATNAGAAAVITALQNAKCIDPVRVAKILKDELAVSQRFLDVRRTQLAIDTYNTMLLEIQVLASTKVMPAACTITGNTFSPGGVLATDIRALITAAKTSTPPSTF